MTQIITHTESGEKTQDINSINVPDMWHLAMRLKDHGKDIDSDMVLECWHLANDLKTHIATN